MGAHSKNIRFRRTRLFILVTAGVILTILIEPHVLRFSLKYGLIYLARLHSKQLTIGRVEGTIFEPLVFRDIEFTSQRAGVVSKARIGSAETSFAWKALLLRGGNGFFDKLTLDDLHGDVVFEPDKPTSQEPASPPPTPAPSRPAMHELQLPGAPWFPLPTLVDVWRANLLVHAAGPLGGCLSLSNVHFSVNHAAPGDITIDQAAIEQSGFNKSFTALHGTTALQENRLVVADLNLHHGIWLKSLSTDLNDLAHGGLRVDFDFAAFDGAIRGELVNIPREKQHPDYEIAGTFWQISVAALADFLDVHENTGGIIKEGKFTFRGSPQALDKSTLSTRLEATDFLWGKRQWNSLVLGATVVDRRVQIPELRLQQAHNALNLKGDVALPQANVPWWESAFNFDVQARINNLTELSVLFGPRFADTAGVVTADGSIRCEKNIFSGQLTVAGNNLSYRGMPIDLLNAGIKLDGNELQVENLEMVHGNDFVRGKGTVSILGEKRYSGEIKASVGDLANYSPLLEKPIAPAPLAGGVVVDWSGDGTPGAHSGAFTAHFTKLRTTGSPEVPATLPIDADLEGTYAPGGLFLSKCNLANGNTKLVTRVAADQNSLKLEDLKLTQKNTLWLEGSATLPVNLFRWWTAPGIPALTPDSPFKLQLTAHGVQLDDVAHLTGHPVPISGILSCSLKTDGTLNALQMSGSLKLTQGSIPKNPWIPALDNVEAEAKLDGNVLRFSKFAAHHAIGDFVCSGAVDFSKFDNPSLDFFVHGEKVAFSAGPAWSGQTNLDLYLAGNRKAATVTGTAEIASLETSPAPDFGPLISTGSGETINVPAPTFALQSPIDGWRFDLMVTTPEPVKLPHMAQRGKATATAALHVTGTGEALATTGSIAFSGLPLKTEFTSGTVETANYFWGTSGAEALAARVAGRVLDTAFTGYFIGPVGHLSSTFISEPEISETDLRTLLSQGFVPLQPDAGELHPDLGPFATPFAEPTPPAPGGAAEAESGAGPVKEPISNPAPTPGAIPSPSS